MTAIGHDVQLHLGPSLLQLPRCDRRRAAVVPTLDDYARDPVQFRRPRAAAGLPRASRGSPCSDSRSARSRPPCSGSVKCSIVSGLGSKVTMSPSHLLHAFAAAQLLVLVVAGQPLAIGFDQVAALTFRDGRKELVQLVRIDLRRAALACTSSRSHIGRTGRCRAAQVR